MPKDNKILLLEGQDFSRDSDNYIILTHELTHCARGTSYETEDGYKKRIKYLLPDMTSEEAEQVFEDFCNNAMNRFDIMKRPYAISIDNFRPAFEQCMQELEIT